MKSTKNGHSPFSVDFKEMTQESRFEGGHRPKIEIPGSSRQNICRRRDPKCYFDLIPKRKINNQWKKLETKIQARLQKSGLFINALIFVAKSRLK